SCTSGSQERARSTAPRSSSAPRPSTATRTIRAGSCCERRPTRRSSSACAARAAATSRRWRASPCSARRPSRACPRWRCGPSRTRSTSPTAGGGASRRPGCSSPPRCPRSSRSSPVPELPPPLPPEKRTVGQLVAEAIRFYGGRFWQVLPLGLPLAIADQLSVGHSIGIQMLVYWGTLPLFVAGYLRACNLVLGGTVNRVAAGVAVLVYLPFPALRAFFVLPGLA